MCIPASPNRPPPVALLLFLASWVIRTTGKRLGAYCVQKAIPSRTPTRPSHEPLEQQYVDHRTSVDVIPSPIIKHIIVNHNQVMKTHTACLQHSHIALHCWVQLQYFTKYICDRLIIRDWRQPLQHGPNFSNAKECCQTLNANIPSV